MTKIKSSNVPYDIKISIIVKQNYYVAHVVNVGAHVDLSMLTDTTNMTIINHKI